MRMPRIALFTDSYHEANGVARMVQAIETCAKERKIPLLSVHAGPETSLVRDGSVVRFELKRARAMSVSLKRDLKCDLSIWRHSSRVAEAVEWFAPDVLHFTGPGDIGHLGAYAGRRYDIPMVSSWHTNLHEHASRRLRLNWATHEGQALARGWVEQQALGLIIWFYKKSRVILAPNRDVAAFLETKTGKPTFVLSHGVDTDLFTPARRRRPNAIVNIGYVGHLTPEKNVRLLKDIESELDAEGLDVRFTIVGDGSERAWLRKHLMRAQFTGMLRDEALANAYAHMDVFAFPSESDASANVVLEAMASGVAPVLMDTAARRLGIETGESAVVAKDAQELIRGVRMLVKQRPRREAMGAAARAQVMGPLSWDRTFAELCNAYDAAMSMPEGANPKPLAFSPA